MVLLRHLVVAFVCFLGLLAMGGNNSPGSDSPSERLVQPRESKQEKFPKPQLLILTDIGGDPDDQQSMRRLMLYANESRIVGLIATAAGIPGELKKEITRPELIHDIVNDYEKVRENLLKHAPSYPSAKELRKLVKSGNPKRGVKSIGKEHSTEGSRHIISAVDAATDGPVHVAIWGGATDLAQALFEVRATRPKEKVKEFLSRLRVYAVCDQDGYSGNPGTGAWIRKNFPELRYVESGPPGMSPFAAAFRGMYQNDAAGGGHPVLQLVKTPLIPMNQEKWVLENVKKGHGPLGANYPIQIQNPHTKNNTRGVKEGDTPSWFYVLPNGLGDPEQPTWGGWGGRFQHDKDGHFIDAEDEHWSGNKDAGLRRKWTVARWREAFQNDFAARLDWCVQPPHKANHNPIASINGDASKQILRLTAKPGSTVLLNARGSSDPDGNKLQFHWFVYSEASTYEGKVKIAGDKTAEATVSIPAGTAGNTIHVILQVTDNGTPSLTGFRRVVIEVAAEKEAE